MHEEHNELSVQTGIKGLKIDGHLKSSAMVSMAEGREDIATTFIKHINDISNLNELLLSAIKHKFKSLVFLIIEQVALIEQGTAKLWSALAMMQSIEITSVWKGHDFQDTYEFLIQSVARAPILLDANGAIDADEKISMHIVLGNMISRFSNKHTNLLLEQKHIRDVIDYDELLFKALDARHCEMALKLIGNKTNRIPSAICRMQSEKSNWNADEHLMVYRKLIDVLNDRVSDLAIYSDRLDSVASDEEKNEEVEIVEENSSLELEEGEQVALLEALHHMIKHFENNNVEYLFKEIAIQAVLSLLDKRDSVTDSLYIQERVGFKSLVIEALRVGNGDLVCLFAEHEKIANLVDAIAYMQSFGTTFYGWKTGSYESCYRKLVNTLIIRSIELEAVDLTEAESLKEKLTSIVKYMLSRRLKCENDVFERFLETTPIRKLLNLDELLLYCIDVKNFRMAKGLAVAERTNVPSVLAKLFTFDTLLTSIQHQESYSELYGKLVFALQIHCAQCQREEQKTALNQALKYMIQAGHNDTFKRLLNCLELKPYFDFSILLNAALQYRNGELACCLRHYVSAKELVDGILLLMNNGGRGWAEIDYTFETIFSSLVSRLSVVIQSSTTFSDQDAIKLERIVTVIIYDDSFTGVLLADLAKSTYVSNIIGIRGVNSPLVRAVCEGESLRADKLLSLPIEQDFELALERANAIKDHNKLTWSAVFKKRKEISEVTYAKLQQKNDPFLGSASALATGKAVDRRSVFGAVARSGA